MRRIVQKIEITLISFYVNFLSIPLRVIYKGGCRFEPTCSEYSILAIKKYGPVKGLYMAIIRILRCSPLSKHPKEYPLT